MPLVKTVDAFLNLSYSLLQASPVTTRISTKYRFDEESKGFLTVKTYDPVSGICIRFRTDQAVDVSRLFLGKSRLGHVMANINVSLEQMLEQMANLTEQKVVESGKKHKKKSKR
ncbi:hypothetical protein PNEG_01609 [Pneumocystis murina B123]|uniref:SRP9 domain-containing protein n=1 Tax=Pneumocystis murina (strain B123) TaxID=1069680 RepID=M7NTE6_PNEMU|nr:hypothetical protein PNEG_01609 [Pneumocystis murina B123]EMR10356.1 hypothetical protein PNEG_01609 [Pneumocystis murina B123]